MLFEWVKSNGGYVNSKVYITVSSDDIRGVYTTSRIRKGEIIFRIPPSLLLCRPTFCDLVTALADEISLGVSSFFWPLLYSMEELVDLDMVYTWNEEERSLLSGLYPSSLVTNTANKLCPDIDTEDSTTLRAIQLVGTRSAGNEEYQCLIPLFDSINHAQWGYGNSAIMGDKDVDSIVYATDNINVKIMKQNQQQILTTYGDNSFYSLFLSYGFLSQYPRLFKFEESLLQQDTLLVKLIPRQISFLISERKDVDDRQYYQFDFNPYNVSYQSNVAYLHKEVANHLITVLATEPVQLKQNSHIINPTRYNTAATFRKEYIKGFQLASNELNRLVTEYRKDRVCSHEYCLKQNTLFDWVEANSGYVHSKLQITVHSKENMRGVFAASPIDMNETIFTLPPNLLLCRTTYCDLVAALGHELSKGNSSFWWPMLSIMEDQELDLPYTWTEEERNLLSGLYPYELATTTIDDDGCFMLDMTKEINIRASQLVTSRNAGTKGYNCLIPIYDSVNHIQEGNENSLLSGHRDGGAIVGATKHISKGQELRSSYGNNAFYRLFRDYGFFSPYPRLWIFKDEEGDEISFKIILREDGGYNFDFNPKHLAKQENVTFLYHAISNHLVAVFDSEPLAVRQRSGTVNSKRYDTALAYREEYVNAFLLASNRLSQIVFFSHLIEEHQEEKEPCVHEYCQKQNALYEWIHGNGGYVNPKLIITTGSDPSWNVRGIFTHDTISSDETLFRIPSDLALCHQEFCDVVTALSHEILLGPSSFWWPYISIMEDHELDLPYTWNDEERDLLGGLYPKRLSTHTAHDICPMLDITDDTNIRALQLVGSRSAKNQGYICMVPLFDSINHAQEGFENSELTGHYDDEFVMLAINDIFEKEQVMDTFGDNSFHRLYSDYGFFSQYPRSWVFEDDHRQQINFKILKGHDGESYEFNLNPNNMPHQEDISYLYQAITKHLTSVLKTEPLGFSRKRPTVSARRYESALAFREEYIKSFQMASDYLSSLIDSVNDTN